MGAAVWRRVVRDWRRRGLASVARRWAVGWRWVRMRVLPPGAAQVSQMRVGVSGVAAGWAAAASSATRREPSSRWGRSGSVGGKRVAGWGLLLVVGGDGFGGGAAVVLYPSVHKPEGVAQAVGQGGGGFVEFGLGARAGGLGCGGWR